MSVNHAVVVRVTEPQHAEVSDIVQGEVHELLYEKLGIDDVRECVVQAQRRPLEHDVQTLLIRTDFITHESQNALLKILEEPPVSTQIVLVIPTDLPLLPTVLSRVQVVELTVVSDDTAFTAFLAADYATRLKQIETAAKQKDTVWQRAIKRGLIAYVESNTPASQPLEYVARTVLTRGASNKMLLEHIALVLPVRK